MTKQEEIREGIAETIRKTIRKSTYESAGEVVKYLHSKNCVIKVEGELPKLKSLIGEASIEEKSAYLLGIEDCKEQMSGYYKTEPLIEG